MRLVVGLTMLAVAAVFAAWAGFEYFGHSDDAPANRATAPRVVPVEVAAVTRGPLERRRTFTGTLTPYAEFVVAPKISGRIERLSVDLADSVSRGQVVAKLDDDEYVQAEAQVQADLAVASANLAEAQALLGIAGRELERVERLRERGVSSESQIDVARAEQLARRARVEVTRAQVTRAQAELEAQRIRLGYATVNADWHDGADQRVVAERYVDEGETVAANAPLLRIVELDPVIAVFNVTERDYALLSTGQGVQLTTDAFPGEVFAGTITRIAPVFRESTRQARVEVRVDNPQLRLKAGLFVRVTVILERIENATIVPEQALVQRDSGTGVFSLAADRSSVDWRAVEVGIRDGNRVQLLDADLAGEVVTLGQQLLEHGTPVAPSAGTARP